MTDIVLIDDDGVTAIFAHSIHAANVTQEVATALGMEDLDWELPEFFYKEVGVAVVSLCTGCVPEFAEQLSSAGLSVIIDNDSSRIIARGLF